MAVRETLTFDSIALNDGTSFTLQGLEIPPPNKRFEWVPGGDADGAALVRDPLFENREITARVRVVQQSTMDLALAKIGSLVDSLEEAEKQENGLPLVWTPANSTKTITFYVVSGSIENLPVTLSGDDAGWFLRAPIITLKLICKAFGYGTEVVGSATSSSSSPFHTVTIASVPGDVPAEGRLIVTDAATQVRRHLEWGLEQLHYDSGTSLIVESDGMSVTNTAGAQTTRTGAYDPGAAGNNVIRATLWRGPVAVAATGNLSHVGTFRVKARVYGSTTGVYARLSWQEGDGSYHNNPYAQVPVGGAFSEIDLGIISIPAKDLGTQRWSGRIEAYADVAGDTIDVDYLVLVPAGEGYGKARATGQPAISAVNGYDDFTSLGSGVALNARVAPSGGTWATSGVATDFIGNTPSGQAYRSTISEATPRYAILGSTSFTNVQVEVFVQVDHWNGTNTVATLIARWTDANNYVAVEVSGAQLALYQKVAGVRTTLKSTTFNPSSGLAAYGLRLTVYATGVVIAEVRNGASILPPLQILKWYSSVLATGGALQTGKPGFADQEASSVTSGPRLYDWFSVGTPLPEPIVINSTRSVEIRSDAVLRADSTNTYWGPPPAYRGSRFFVPPAGPDNRTSRVLVKAHRADIETDEAVNVTDNLTVQVNYTPRYSVIPR